MITRLELQTVSLPLHTYIHLLHTYSIDTYDQAHNCACTRHIKENPTTTGGPSPQPTIIHSPSHGTHAQCNPPRTDRAPRLALSSPSAPHGLQFYFCLCSWIVLGRRSKSPESTTRSSAIFAQLPNLCSTSRPARRSKGQGVGDGDGRWSPQMPFKEDMA